MTDFTQDYSTSTNGGFQQSSMDSQGGGDSKGSNDDRKIFVGGLSWETTVKDLREYFEGYGPVDDCTLKTDPATGRSRGFGFVTFLDSGAVDKVLSEPQGHHLHGRKIDPKRAKARGGREPILKVFVGGLDPTVPEQDIRDYFGQFGKVTEVDLPFDKQKNQRRAFAFVSFESEEMVDKVCELPKREGLGSKPVDIKKATPKSEQQGGYGGRGGRGGGRGGYGQGGGWGASGGYGGYGGQGGGYDYSGYGGYGQTGGYGGGGGYDYSSGGYGQGYGSYDYGNYGGGSQQGWSGYGYGGSQGGGAGSYSNY